jgi:hypothetical protein
MIRESLAHDVVFSPELDWGMGDIAPEPLVIDPLGPSRGVMVGLIIMAPFWCAVAWIFLL